MQVLILFFFCLTTLFANHQLEPVSIQLTWFHQFQSAGFYVAKEKGFYEELDLDVTIRELHPNINIVESVISGESTYGIGKSSLIIERNNHKPIIALMALFQHAPSVLISTNPVVQTPKDLFNRIIMMNPQESSSVAILAMLRSHGIQQKDIYLQYPSFNLDDLIHKKVDAMSCYISNEPFSLKKRNISYTILNPKEYGYDFYGDILFTSENEVFLHKERAKRFYTATREGWEWAFEHIPETAQLIYEKYNTQNKSLEALIYEGEALKKLALDDDKPFGMIEAKKFEEIANAYKISGILKNGYDIKGFIDPLHFAKDMVKIGILASREESNVFPKTWSDSAQYLSDLFPTHQFTILPLNFEEMKKSLEKGEIEFILTNPMYAIQLENIYGISRIATLSPRYKDHFYSEYGSVIFTKADASHIKTYTDLGGKKIGAVSAQSFGGYLLGIKELKNPSLTKQITFLGTHYNVVHAVLEGSIDAGIIRTDVLERMQDEGFLKLSDVKILGEKHYPNFPFVTSTELYPEWVLAKAPHTSEYLTNELLSTLLKLATSPKNNQAFRVKTPLDYSKVHTILKEFNIYPYEKEPFTFEDVIVQYKLLFLGILTLFIVTFLFMAYIHRLNKKLLSHTLEIEHFNETLEQEVEERTHALSLLNSKLKKLANTDELTKIDNRRHFLLMATQYFYTSIRNNMELHILSLDIDFFKNVNDTYGHPIGDQVLKFFCKNIKEVIRQSDLFGRVGGEEFCICIQNTTQEGAKTLSEKIRKRVEVTSANNDQNLPAITVSIGMSSLEKSDKEVFDIIKRSDEALYRAKNNGRNQVQVIL